MSTGTDGREPYGTVAGNGQASREREQEISVRVTEINDNRAVIEQAKGMLMFIYGVGDEIAFEMLRIQSQHHNVKLRLLAEQIVKDIAALSDPAARERLLRDDELLMTAYRRIDLAAQQQLERSSNGVD